MNALSRIELDNQRGQNYWKIQFHFSIGLKFVNRVKLQIFTVNNYCNTHTLPEDDGLKISLS